MLHRTYFSRFSRVSDDQTTIAAKSGSSANPRPPNPLISVSSSGTNGGPTDRLGQLNGYSFSHPEPLARAPDNVFVFRGRNDEVLGWRNVFDLPIQYDVELCPGLLSPESSTLAFRFLPEDGPRRRFIVIGESLFYRLNVQAIHVGRN